MEKPRIDRRSLLIGGAVAGAAGSAAAATWRDGQLGASPQSYAGQVPWKEGVADAPPAAEPGGYRYFTQAELDFILPAIDRLIPPDATGPSASQANVHVFLDRQLAGLFGRGDHFYLGGPWPRGAPEQGYQSRFSPAQFYRAAIPAIEAHVRGRFGKGFGRLTAEQQDEVLRQLEAGKPETPGVDAQAFFAMFLQNVLEGYFSDPVYGGNKDMAAWKMIGFPGAHYDYKEWAGRHGERVPFETVAIMGRPGWTEG